MICRDAGPLGRTVEHPGPIVGYFAHEAYWPKWIEDLPDAARILAVATPIRSTV